MQFDPDAQTIALIRNGMTHAYGQIVKRYAEKASSLARRIVKDDLEAEDIVQDAFIRAYRSLPSFKGDAKFSTWFYRIVYNTALNAATRQRRQPEMLEMNEDVLGTWTEDDLPAQMDETLAAEIVAEAMEAMPSIYGVILDLFYVQDRSHEEIVSITGLPLGTVKTRLHRGRTYIRTEMQRRCPELFLERT